MTFDFNQLFEAAQKMQAEATRLREDLARQTVEGDSGGGLVRCTANATGEILSLSLDAAVAAADTADKKKLLEDLVVGAINVALDRGRELARQEMSKLTGGLPVPPGTFG